MKRRRKEKENPLDYGESSSDTRSVDNSDGESISEDSIRSASREFEVLASPLDQAFSSCRRVWKVEAAGGLSHVVQIEGSFMSYRGLLKTWKRYILALYPYSFSGYYAVCIRSSVRIRCP